MTATHTTASTELAIRWNWKNHNRNRNPEFKQTCLDAIIARNVQLLALAFAA